MIQCSNIDSLNIESKALMANLDVLVHTVIHTKLHSFPGPEGRNFMVGKCHCQNGMAVLSPQSQFSVQIL